VFAVVVEDDRDRARGANEIQVRRKGRRDVHGGVRMTQPFQPSSEHRLS
jgi:hypothetical protein